MTFKKRIENILSNYKIILQIILGLLFVGFGIYFIKKEQAEMGKVKDALLTSDPVWVFWGIFLMIIFILVQGMMYQQSFRAIHEKIQLRTGIDLYLKRNLVSVFLPAGVLTNVLFFNKFVEKKEGVNKTQIYFASSIFSFCSILSAVIIGIPSLFWLLMKGSLSGSLVYGILLTSLLLIFIVYATINVIKQGKVFVFLEQKFPSITQTLDTLFSQSFDRKKIGLVLALSILIEIIGIGHLYIAIFALGGTPTIEMAIIGYAIVLLLLMSSPFLRGVGAVEVALTYSLVLFGLSNILALSVAFLFRFFEFWGVLIFGVIALVNSKNNLLLRLFPAILIFSLGIVNILSGITPALPQRLSTLLEFIPMDAIHASTALVILSGLFMLAISLYLIRGLRNAWLAAIILSIVSFITHLTKGIDWEEAMFALATIISLLYQRKHYFIQPDLKLTKRSLLPGLLILFGVLSAGTVGFYFLNLVHFNTEFTLWNSFVQAISAFFLFNIDFVPNTVFAKEFLYSLNILGGSTMVYVIYLFLRPLVIKPNTNFVNEQSRAKALIEKYGNSSLDYFKTYYDKSFWFCEEIEGFVSFKASGNYVLVLENPVCSLESMPTIIELFDSFCRKNGLRTAYYRIPETNKSVYEQLGKKLFPIGEEAVVNLESWKLEGGSKAGIRNSINKLKKIGYTFQVKEPPQKDAFLQQLKATSDDWLKHTKRSEIAFSQGIFNEKELKNQTILSIENHENKVVGFVNLVSDYIPGEANFDLMRKTADAPNGAMDFLFVMMFEYLKEIGFKTCNLGMVPMSGITTPENLQERVIKLAYEKIKQFGHYKSLREYKEKFDPTWQMMFLTYDATFDLIYLPKVMEQIIEP